MKKIKLQKCRPPKDIIHRYTDGLCWHMAVALSELVHLPIWVVYDKSGCEVHAFVFDQSTSIAYDIRGSLTISEVIAGPWRCGHSIGPWNRKLGVTKKDIKKARTVAKKYVILLDNHTSFIVS